MISFSVLLRSFGVLLLPIILHGFLNKYLWQLTGVSFWSTAYLSLYFFSISIVLFLQLTYKDGKGKSVWVFLGLTILKLLFLMGYMYPILIGLDLEYLYHLLVLTTCMLFLELALLSKTLRLT